MAKKEPVAWITVNGQRIPIMEGEGKNEAIKKHTSKVIDNNNKQKENDIRKNEEEKGILKKVRQGIMRAQIKREVDKEAKEDIKREEAELSKYLDNNLKDEELQKGLTNSLGEKKVPHPIKDALQRANPGRDDPDAAYSNNCQRSVLAYLALRKGYNVEALPSNTLTYKSKLSGEDRDVLSARASWSKALKNFEMKPVKSAEDIMAYMRNIPDGGIVFVRGNWLSGGGGHVFVLEKVNGKLKFVDPQANISDASYYLDNMKNLMLGRADDKIFINPRLWEKIVAKG